MCVESANMEHRNPWEAKEMQILPLELAFYRPFPCFPLLPPSSSPKICSLESDRFTSGVSPLKPDRNKGEFCLRKHTSWGKTLAGFLLSSQGCGGNSSMESVSEWLRLWNNPVEPALDRTLKSKAFLFYSFSFLSHYYILIFNGEKLHSLKII